ncbi:MAG: hypothetical protein M1827_002098 [Pycnora praestabilis]|nr:MAG: hypothetical protein M1827_002098 [Pycnora praestabilis]
MSSERSRFIKEAARGRGKSNPERITRKSKASPESLFQTIIYVTVGQSSKRYGIHMELLCHYSAYFRAALDGNFREAIDGVVDLPEDSEETFANFNEWLYTQKLAFVEQLNQDDENEVYNQLFELYVFADKRGITKLKNDTLDALNREIDAGNEYPIEQLRYVWNNTMQSSPIRTYLEHTIAHGSQSVGAMGKRVEFPKSFLWDVANMLMASGQSLRSVRRHTHCEKFHEHDEFHPGCRKKRPLLRLTIGRLTGNSTSPISV